jgi:hypothetical protein
LIEKTKFEIKTVSVGVIIILLFSFGAWLTNVKADKSEVKELKIQQEKQCEKTEKLEDVIVDIKMNLIEIKTLIKEREQK